MSEVQYGAMTPTDMDVLEMALHDQRGEVISFLEIGFHEGNTARGVKEWCRLRGIKLRYVGVDSGAICTPKPPFEGATVVVGDSAEVFHLVGGLFNVVLIDGCHCFNHVILDFIHYSPMVENSGCLLFHDTSPEIQQTMRDPHGPAIPKFHNSVNKALEWLDMSKRDWILDIDRYESNSKIGGMRVYVRAL